ncbi:MAG TPA: RNA polymerase sigma factor, partial [Polyangiaceae bacterium]|nr:RNA polymerase sigma factor [Polyangiaceae bacterium]
ACSLRTWANRITTHVALNAIRSRQRERRVLERRSEPADVDAPCLPRTEAEVELARLRRHLAEIPPAHAEVLILHDLYGHNLAEIAALVGASEAATQSRLVRGRKQLQSRLSKGRFPFGKAVL